MFFFGYQRQNFFHVVNEAHVQHAVGFVQDQNFNARQVQKTLALQVQQTTGGGDQNVDTAFDFVDLGVHSHATKDHGGIELEVFAVIAHRLFNLSRQFAGWGEHQGADGFAAKAVLARFAQAELVQQRQGERGCFAGAGLSASQQILSGQNGWNGLGLNGGRGVVAEFAHGLHDGRGQIQFFKVHFIERHLRRRSRLIQLRLAVSSGGR